MSDTTDTNPETPDEEVAPDATPDAEADDTPRQSYRVLRGLSYPVAAGDGEKRAQVGDVVDDIPEQSIGWLLDDGAIEKA